MTRLNAVLSAAGIRVRKRAIIDRYHYNTLLTAVYAVLYN